MRNEIIGIEENGTESPTIPSWPVHSTVAVFDGDSGSGRMDLLPSQIFGYWGHIGETPNESYSYGWIDEGASIGVTFDVEWRSSFQRLAVPEPGALILISSGLLVSLGLARRRVRPD